MPIRTAVALFSGGLDSSLAVMVVKDQGIRVVAFHMVSAFCRCTPEGEVHSDIVAGAEELGVELHCFDSNRDLTGLVLAPAHGFGKNLNPCIDCRINTVRRADEFRLSIGADFLISGEVLGQRPMSQNRHAMNLVEASCGAGDLLLRPLSARFLEPTLPEREGWIDRERLPKIQGRGRGSQMALARHYGITRYGSPAGGCLLTESGYCLRLAALLKNRGILPGKVSRERLAEDTERITRDELLLLRVGRHFQGAKNAHLVSGRDEEENLVIEGLVRPGDLLFQASEVMGSVTLLRREPVGGPAERVLGDAALDLTDPSVVEAAGLSVHYSKNREEGHADIEVREAGVLSGAGRVMSGVRRVDPSCLRNLSQPEC